MKYKSFSEKSVFIENSLGKKGMTKGIDRDVSFFLKEIRIVASIMKNAMEHRIVHIIKK